MRLSLQVFLFAILVGAAACNGEKKALVIQPEENVFRVNTVQEFVDAIGHNRTIIVEAETLILNDLNADPEGFVGVSEEFWAYDFGLTIRHVTGLKIIALGEVPAKIWERQAESVVITFDSCKNIQLDNLDFGHIPDDDVMCEKEVAAFWSCRDIAINNCYFFGTGWSGFVVAETQGFNITNSEIYDCSGGVFSIWSSSDISMTNIHVHDIHCYHDGMFIRDVTDMSMTNCRFQGLTGKYLFNSVTSNNVKVENCIFRGNQIDAFTEGTEGIEFSDCRFEKNSFPTP